MGKIGENGEVVKTGYVKPGWKQKQSLLCPGERPELHLCHGRDLLSLEKEHPRAQACLCGLLKHVLFTFLALWQIQEIKRWDLVNSYKEPNSENRCLADRGYENLYCTEWFNNNESIMLKKPNKSMSLQLSGLSENKPCIIWMPFSNQICRDPG